MTLASEAAAAEQVHVTADALRLPNRTTVVTTDFARRVAAGSGLTAPGAVLLASTLLAVGAMADMTFGDSLGVGFSAMFLIASVLMALTIRVRSLLTAVIAPPLLFASAAVVVGKLSGEVRGNRALALDTATTLALSAPVLFTATALAAVVAGVRLVAHLVRRRAAGRA